MPLKSERTELLLVSASSLPSSRPACMKLLAILGVGWSFDFFIYLFNQKFNPGQKKRFSQILLLNRKKSLFCKIFIF